MRCPIRKRESRPWLVLLGCCMMQGGSLGVIMNTMGLFFTAVSQDMGFSIGGISFYKTMAGVSSCILLPFVGRILYRFDTRVTLSLSAVVMGVCTALMAVFQQLWQWYTSAFVLGIASAMLLTASEPIILANWFQEKLGLAIGISAAFSGVMGMVCNVVFEKVIELYGWRIGYCVAGGLCVLMIVPMTAFVVRLKPEMVCCQPYGSKSQMHPPEEVPLAMRNTCRRSILTLLVLAAAVMQFCVGFSAQIVTYSTAMGKRMAMGAFLVSCSMFSNAVGKILLGHIHDAKGLKWACVVGFSFGVPGFLLLHSSRSLSMTAGCLFYGLAMSLAVVMPPLLTRRFFRGSDYPRAFSIVMMLSTLLSSFAPGALGAMYDYFGSYGPALNLCAGLCGAFLILCVGMFLHYRMLSREDSTNKSFKICSKGEKQDG